jgi:hypothetical protein
VNSIVRSITVFCFLFFFGCAEPIEILASLNAGDASRASKTLETSGIHASLQSIKKSGEIFFSISVTKSDVDRSLEILKTGGFLKEASGTDARASFFPSHYFPPQRVLDFQADQLRAREIERMIRFIPTVSDARIAIHENQSDIVIQTEKKLNAEDRKKIDQIVSTLPNPKINVFQIETPRSIEEKREAFQKEFMGETVSEINAKPMGGIFRFRVIDEDRPMAITSLLLFFFLTAISSFTLGKIWGSKNRFRKR